VNGIDDVRFVSEILDQLQSELCINTARVFATGFSNGAFMAAKLACSLDGRIAAVALVGGVSYPASGCGGPVPVLAFHGTSDTVVPLRGGRILDWTYTGAEAALATWMAQNGCSPDGARESVAVAPDAIVERYLGCAAPTSMVLIQGAGHMWPGAGPDTAEGRAANEVPAAEMIWTFFSQNAQS
jgi:polyhydroxybutyrate depolymerase